MASPTRLGRADEFERHGGRTLDRLRPTRSYTTLWDVTAERPNDAGWRSNGDRVLRDITKHNGICPDYGTATDRHASENDGVLPDPGTVADPHGRRFRDPLLHDRCFDVLKRMIVIRDVNVSCEKHASADLHKKGS